LYAPFGADIDRPLRLLFDTYRWWWLAFVPAAAIWQLAATPKTGARRACAYCLLLAPVLGGYAWWAVQSRPLCCDISLAEPRSHWSGSMERSATCPETTTKRATKHTLKLRNAASSAR
jgi:hypothetical protein